MKYKIDFICSKNGDLVLVTKRVVLVRFPSPVVCSGGWDL